jgi:hypothetical protein
MAQPNVKTPAAQKPAATIPSKSPSISSFFSKKTDNTAPSKNEEAKKEDDEEEKKEDDLKPVAITQELNRRQDSVEQAPLEEDDVADVLSKERSSKYPIGTEVKKVRLLLYFRFSAKALLTVTNGKLTLNIIYITYSPIHHRTLDPMATLLAS